MCHVLSCKVSFLLWADVSGMGVYNFIGDQHLGINTHSWLLVNHLHFTVGCMGLNPILHTQREQNKTGKRMPVLLRVKPSSWVRSGRMEMGSSSPWPRGHGFKLFRGAGG